MRVLLLGATGNLGLRVIPALINHKHTVVLYVRNIDKLKSLVSASLLELVHAIVVGDATDLAGIKRALIEHDIESIINVAGNQVLPWKEYLLPKIAAAATIAAISIGKDRGYPLRIWVTGNMWLLQYPGTLSGMQGYIFRHGIAQPRATHSVVSPIPTSQLNWSILAIGRMYTIRTPQGPLQAEDVESPHGLLVTANSLSEWKPSWIESIPVIGGLLWLIYVTIAYYKTRYEAVADFLAEDIGKEASEWIGKAVGVKEESQKRDV